MGLFPSGDKIPVKWRDITHLFFEDCLLIPLPPPTTRLSRPIDLHIRVSQDGQPETASQEPLWRKVEGFEAISQSKLDPALTPSRCMCHEAWC